MFFNKIHSFARATKVKYDKKCLTQLSNLKSKPYIFNNYINNIQSKVKTIKQNRLDRENNLISTSQLFYDSLKRNGVDTTFIYSGGSIMPLIDKLYKSDIKYYVNSHEQNCGHAATGYAKASNLSKPGVVMVTSGPGITNMITPMLDATNDSTPLVVFSGQVSLSAVGSNAFQEAPAVELSKNVTKWSYQVKTSEELESVIDKAFEIALEGKKGAVHIDIPKCVASASINKYQYEQMLKMNLYKENIYKNYDRWAKKNIKENKVFLNHVIDIINKCEKPIIYLGQGCNNDYKLLREFAIKANIPVTSTIHACGTFDDDHSLSLRWCGMHGSAAANYAIQEADCIIALGSRFDDRTTGLIEKYAPKAFEAYNDEKKYGGIIHVNIERSEINKVVCSHYNFNTTCKQFLQNIIDKIEYNPRKTWINKINQLKDKHPFEYKSDTNKLHMEHVLTSIYNSTKSLKDNIIFTTGVGNHQMQTYQFIKSHYPNKIISSGSLGVMGAGLPYGVGAQIANPDKMVMIIDGDSSFNMTLTDLKTIKEHNLPLKIAIMNNDAQMMVTIWEKLFFDERYTATINKNNPSFTDIAEAYGIKALSCDNTKNLEQTIKKFIDYKKPILCEFKIEKGICLPLVGPGKALDDMILPNTYDTNIRIKEGIAPS